MIGQKQHYTIWVTKRMLLVKRDEISLRESIVRTHQKFQLERRIKKSRTLWRKSTVSRWVLLTAWLVVLSVLLTRRKERKVMLPVCLLSAFWPALSTIYNGQWFLVEDFFLLVINPPGTWIPAFLQNFEVQLFFSCYQRSFVCPARSNLSW